MRVGVIGAGRMGVPMISRLVAAGHHVTALGRSPEKRDAVTELGASAASDHVEVADGADVVIVCVFTDEQVREICVAADLTAAMSAEAVLVLHTTGSPHTAEQVAALAAPRHVGVVDAPVSGGPHDIAAAHLTVFAGGDDQAVAHARPALESYADPVLHVGPLGAGQRVKLINNALFAAQVGLVAEGVRLGRRLGIDEPTLLNALVNGSAGSRALSGVAATGSADAFIARVGEFIGKDVAVVRRAAADLHTDLGLLDRVVDAGLR